MKTTVFSDGDVPIYDVSPEVSNKNQVNRWLKISTDTMDYTNIYRKKPQRLVDAQNGQEMVETRGWRRESDSSVY